MKRNIIILPILAIGLLVSSGCAHKRAKASTYAKQCNDSAAYEKGVNDALKGVRMSSEWVSYCDIEIRDEIRAKYQDGYVTALKNAPSKVKK